MITHIKVSCRENWELKLIIRFEVYPLHFLQSPQNTDSESSDSHSDTEAPPTLTPSALLNNNHHHHHRNSMTTIENIAANIAAVAALNPPGAGVSNLPFYPPSLMQTSWYLPNATRNFHVERMETEKSGEQPLDLSSKTGNVNNSSGGTNNNGTSIFIDKAANMRFPLDTKHIFKWVINLFLIKYRTNLQKWPHSMNFKYVIFTKIGNLLR